MYVYRKTGTQNWTVGFYAPDGEWMAESDHDSSNDAAEHVHYLNGGDYNDNAAIYGNGPA